MNSIVILLIGVALTQAPPTGKVDSTFDTQVNFAAFKTYAWSGGARAFNPEADKIIVAALDAEMVKLGFTRTASGADVMLSYQTTTVANVDLEALDKLQRAGLSDAAPSSILGKLIVSLRDPATGRALWSASTREHIEPQIAKLAGTVGSVAARLFETYPTRTRPR